MSSSAASGPLASRIRDELARRIASGELARGEQLPTERELSDVFDVSRVTVRRALAALAGDGLVHAVQGRGTFVSSQFLTEPPNRLMSFRDLAASGNLVAGAEPLEVSTRSATISEAELLDIAPGAKLFVLVRLRTLDGLPVAVDESLIPLALDPALPDLDWNAESLYARLAAVGHTPIRADYAVEAQAADDVAADLLQMEVGAPVLVAASHTFSAADRLIEAGRITYRGDRYRFRSTLTAAPSAVPDGRRPQL